MQTREETNTDASLGNTPLAVPLATERNPSKRGCRGICSLAKCSGSQVSVLRYDVLMPDHSTTSSRCGAVFLRHSNIRCRCLGWVKSGKASPEQMLSALPPKADKQQTFLYVRLVPKPDSCTATYDLHGCNDLLDHLVGEREQPGPALGQGLSRPSPSCASRSISSPADTRSGRADATPPPPEWLRAACSSPRVPCSPRASSPRTGTSGESCAHRCARSPCP